MTVRRGRLERSPLSLSCDVAIVGSGAGGSMAAYELAGRGLSVVVLEEGAYHRPRQFDQREEHMLPSLFRELGGQRTDDLSLLVLSGRGVGGSTVHNTNLCKRTAPEILAHWREEFGLSGLETATLDPLFAEVESLLGVVPIRPEQLSSHNAVFKRGVEALGHAGGMLSHNRDDRCIGSGFCELGCAYDGKKNALRVLLPEAMRRGAVVVSDARVDRVVYDDRRASAVRGRLLDEHGVPRGDFEVRCEAVCLAGSAIGSASVALRSGLPDPHQQIGRHLHLHPGVAVAGRFEERVEGWRGIPQSYECTEFLDLSPGSERRAWILPSFAHPVGTATVTPGFGPRLLSAMRAYPHLGVLAAMVHDVTEGRVYLEGDRTRIAYVPGASDRAQLALGAREASRILLAAGARDVMMPGVPPATIRTEAELEEITEERFHPHDVPLTAVHPMGSMRMGTDPRSSVVDATGRLHTMDNVWVTDGSLFPTSIGTPPQLSIYTFALKVARGLELA
ncbi:MAG: GMC family oxidoreductase [Sandaracinaceae bacterium]|nr:GMC family oxidoreductase [Sandaracinaceae bacterium]